MTKEEINERQLEDGRWVPAEPIEYHVTLFGRMLGRIITFLIPKKAFDKVLNYLWKGEEE